MILKLILNYSRGSVASSLPSECDFSLTQDPYNIRTYGFKIDPMPNDFRTVASSKLIEMVATNDQVTNEMIADEILKALLEDPEYAEAQCLKITQKVSFNIASKASYVYIFSRQKFTKNAKN